jgi:hypothetical protein
MVVAVSVVWWQDVATPDQPILWDRHHVLKARIMEKGRKEEGR